jgi:hypothetical protein
MKHLLLLAALFSTPVLAQDLICSADGFSTRFIIDNTSLVDTNEHVVAEEVKPGLFVAKDRFGTVTYILHGNNIIMQFDGITKEYTCQ